MKTCTDIERELLDCIFSESNIGNYNSLIKKCIFERIPKPDLVRLKDAIRNSINSSRYVSSVWKQIEEKLPGYPNRVAEVFFDIEKEVSKEFT